ncbi:MAG: hypothetical protein ABEI57_06905 [Halapricum sp.]
MAAIWMWILAYVLVFVTFQLLLYRYLQGEDGPTVEHAAPDYGDGEMVPRQAVKSAVETDDREGIRCPRCGTYNERDAAYTYCRECVQRLR